ncbi:MULTISPECIES: AAA family ATPase [unclassified Paenibacillus]|uniref:AAA family ATPase n=1 Tax=unclassified Paenibacillus TaxID=185978 RepID=UPI0015A2CE9E|nr:MULTISPECIES: AAA family ATPase [unclassified Paenibacillus]
MERETGMIRYLKAPHPEYANEFSSVRLPAELRQAAKLQSAGVWMPAEPAEWNGVPALLMQPVEGQPLVSYIRSGPMELTLFLHLAAGMAEAVSKLHQAKHLHLALSPQAFFVESNRRACRLTELHLAAPFSAAAEQNPGAHPQPDGDEGALLYTAPERIGRLYRRVDPRTDIYALGVLFYRMLTGVHPFDSADPAELAHSHVAKDPEPLTAWHIPKPVSDIVNKCLVKQPDGRYPSSFALQRDLNTALEKLLSHGYIEDYEIEADRISDQFSISESIYGRENELQLLENAYKRAETGSREVVFVSGISGIGKSYLIHEFQKLVHQRGGLFVSGKFDQFQRDTPYHALHQAGNQLHQHLLTLGEDELQLRRDQILQAVGGNGQVLIDMNPSFEALLGPQNPLPKLPPAEMHNRFVLTLQSFLSVFSSREQPLVVFLDDLQWADAASIQLLHDMSIGSLARGCLYIGAFRDREMGANQAPLRKLMEHLEGSKHFHYTGIRLEALQAGHLERLLADSLQPSGRSVKKLSQLMMQKTRGNPFFTKQLFRSIFEQQLLWFDYATCLWTWDEDKIQELHMTENVVDFMINKIVRLPEMIQHLLMHAACIGHQFTTDILALSSGLEHDEIRQALLTAEKDGLIHGSSLLRGAEAEESAAYKFLHDRVYQALYSLVSDEDKAAMHLKIGRILEQKYRLAGSLEMHSFEIANQLNLGSSLLQSREERERLAQLNLIACRRAKTSSAYDTGLRYARHGCDLLETDCWDTQYAVAYALLLEKAELEYLSGNFEEAKLSFSSALGHAKTRLEKADAHTLMMVLCTNMGEHEEALRIGLEGLQLLGIRIKSRVGKSAILWELLKSQVRKGTRSVDDLLDIPVMTDAHHQAVIRLLLHLIAPAYYLNSELYVYLMLRMFNYSLLNGHTEASALAYSTYGVISSSVLGRLQAGYDYGMLGVKLSESFNHLPVKCKVYFGYGAFTSQVKEPISNNIEQLHKAYQFGVQSGDFVYAGYAITFSFFLRLFKGDHLTDVLKETEQYQSFILKAKDRDTAMILTVLQRYMLNLKEKTPLLPPGTDAETECFMTTEELSELPGYTNKAIIHTYYAMQGHTYYLFQRLHEARKLLEEAEASLSNVFGMLHIHLHHFNYAMVLAGLYPEAGAAEKKRYRSRIRKSLRFLDKWAQHSPDNFLHLKLLLEAEWHRIHDDRHMAEEKYDQAIHYAGKHRSMQYEAIASECAARHYFRLGKLKIARSYLVEARSLYAQSGAERKVADLDERYPYLVGRGQAESSIDMSSLVKASQAMYGETVLQQMLDVIMAIVLEHAGAERGLLTLVRDGRLYIEAEKSLQAPFEALQASPLDSCEHAAISVIQYAARSAEPVLLHDAVHSELFGKDPYIQARRPRSVLSLPVSRSRQLVGVLYLENNLATHVFHEERLQTLKLLASEIAVLIENAKLYDHIESRDYKLQLLEEQERSIRKQLSEKERWIQSSEATMLNIRKAQHELINNVQTVHALLMMNKYDMAKDYISVWCKEIVHQSVIGSVKFPVLGVVLNNLSLTCISGKVELQVDGDLACTFEELTLPISYFSSIMHNLLKNAVEAIPPDDTLRTVRLTLEEQQDGYKLTVFNTGSYIPEAKLAKIFDKGFTTKPESGNSGLGLHIAQHYAEHYGGRIDCISKLHEGTSFFVYLPKRRQSQDLPPGLRERGADSAVRSS